MTITPWYGAIPWHLSALVALQVGAKLHRLYGPKTWSTTQ